MTRRRRRGFSIVELMMVLTILGLLVRIGMPKYWDLRRRATARAIIGDVQAIRVAAYNYHTEHNTWPPDVGAGAAPPPLVTYLPEGFDFQRPGYVLDWEVWSAPGGLPGNPAATHVVGVGVQLNDPLLAAAVHTAASVGIPYMVSGGTTTFLLAGIGQNY